MSAEKRPTALVTGASEGIGEEFAKLLAGSGHDLVLLSRSAERLNRVKEALSAGNPGRIEILPLDLSDPASPEKAAAFLQEKGLEIDVLVNNAGYGHYGLFGQSELGEDLGQIQVNVTSLTHLTKLLLPGMIRRGRGRILNVASTAAFQPGPLMAVYYASKAYVLSFSEALANELRGTGVTATCLCPGPTKTGFMRRAKLAEKGPLTLKGVLMEPAKVAKRGYDGMMNGKRLVIPGVLNRLLAHSTRLGSRGLSAKIVRGILEGMNPNGS